MKKIIIVATLVSMGSCNPSNEQKETSSASAAAYSTEGKKVVVYTTADSTTLRLSITDTLSFQDLPQPLETDICVFVDPTKSFQSLLGIGGALTDASAETFAKIPLAKQQELLTAYYDKDKGIGYTLGRTQIHSCDFSSDTYTYVAENDSSLKTFSIEHDRKFRIPFIKKAIAAAGGKITLFCSPWSPPAWMKTNNDILHGGKLKTTYYQAWANYYVKFIHAYEAEGIPLWGLTIQNEPMATQKWESCVYAAEDEREFLKNYLGPTLEKEGLGDKKNNSVGSSIRISSISKPVPYWGILLPPNMHGVLAFIGMKIGVAEHRYSIM